ncbi:hypothetical protein JHK84_028258 [Glycine max]|nr:hypothetical protein JHK85_028671 [Glycine max]KAG5003995.1 hypothetical protein JHK86_028134 [Glycine max]KAG5151786.1 hypothetical protein JHK84_028258 [Glycine max]
MLEGATRDSRRRATQRRAVVHGGSRQPDKRKPCHDDNVELVRDVGGSSNDPVVDAFDLDNLIFLEPNGGDKQSEEDLDDDGDGDESDDIHGDDPIRGLDMLL